MIPSANSPCGSHPQRQHREHPAGCQRALDRLQDTLCRQHPAEEYGASSRLSDSPRRVRNHQRLWQVRTCRAPAPHRFSLRKNRNRRDDLRLARTIPAWRQRHRERSRSGYPGHCDDETLSLKQSKRQARRPVERVSVFSLPRTLSKNVLYGGIPLLRGEIPQDSIE